MNDHGAVIAVDNPDLEHLAGSAVGTNQHEESVVESLDPYGISKGVKDVVVCGPVLACALRDRWRILHALQVSLRSAGWQVSLLEPPGRAEPLVTPRLVANSRLASHLRLSKSRIMQDLKADQWRIVVRFQPRRRRRLVVSSKSAPPEDRPRTRLWGLSTPASTEHPTPAITAQFSAGVDMASASPLRGRNSTAPARAHGCIRLTAPPGPTS